MCIVSSEPGNTAAPTADKKEDDDGRREPRDGGGGCKRARGAKGTFENKGQGVKGGVSVGEWPMVVSLAGH